MKKILLYILLSLVSLFSGVYAQIVDSESYNLEDGLSNSRVQALAMEQSGLLWIGTADGVNTFDGVKFRGYKNQPFDTKSLCDNRIQTIFISQDQSVWIGTKNGLSTFERSKGTFLNYYHDATNPSSISNNNILGVFEDRNHNLWIQTAVSIDLYDKKNKKFIHYYLANDFFHFVSKRISAITEDRNGDIWIATKDGLNRLDRQLNLFERYTVSNGNQTLGSNVILSLKNSKKGYLWVGTDKKLCIYNFATKRFNAIWPIAEGENIKSSILAITEDKNGQIWVVTESKMLCFSENGRLIKTFKELEWRNTAQSFSTINTILCDNSNILWMGTNLGLAKFDLKKKKFGLIQHYSNKGLVLDVTAVYSSNNNLWFGTKNSGIIKVDLKKGLRQKEETFFSTFFSNLGITSIYETRQKHFLVGTENGLFVKSELNQSFVDACKIPKGEEDNLKIHHRIHKIAENKEDDILVATEQGIHVFSSDLSSLRNINHYKTGVEEYELGEVFTFSIENKNELWAGTKGGLIKIDIKNNTGKLYQIASKYHDVKAEVNLIFDIYDDGKGKLWLATSGGLASFEKKTGAVTYIENTSGIVYSNLYSILNDSAGNLWISSNKGIIKYNIKSNNFNSFNISDGLQGYEFNPSAAAKGNDGFFYFGGLSGVNYFSPDSMEYNTFKPKMIISSFDIIKEGKRLPIYVNSDSTQHIVLPRDVNSFSIDFAVLDYSNVLKNNYIYRLVKNGKETNWIDHQNRTSVSFTNLSPGTYKFEVKGCNNDGVWSDSPASLFIEIKSPWWASIYAFGIYFIVFVLLILFVIQIRTYNLRKSNRMLREKEIAARKIEKQREELAIQNKNIRDSINYAKRLQEALMPSEKIVRKFLPNSFVFHRPKDIVSGDFFWVSNHGNRLILAAIDCTGHGVPGAFMSIIGYELFRKITSTHPMKKASELLQLLTDEFVCIFKDIEEFSMHDGMDVSLCCIDLKTNIIEYAGAFNPLYFVRNNKVEEVKGNRFSVSIRTNKEIESTGFQNHQIQAMAGDVFYIFSDGYADQFGGAEGKKFKYRRFRHLLLSIHRLSFAEQRSYLSESIDLWKGNLEQVDDVLVIGFKLL